MTLWRHADVKVWWSEESGCGRKRGGEAGP